MADSILSAITAKTTPVGADILYIVDTQDTTQNAAGSSKSLTIGNLTTNYLASVTETLTNKTYDTAGIGNVLKINGTAISAITGTGSVVLATSPTISSPTLTTPTIGVATATSINKVTITAPATSATLTIANGKTLTVNNSLTLAGTDSTTMTFPSTSATIARTDAAQTFTGTQTFASAIFTNNAITASGNAATVPVTSRFSTVTNNSAATLTITMTTTSAVDGQLTIVRIYDFSAVAQTITWVNTENSNISAPTTSNGSTTLPVTVGFMYNSATSKWRCIASA
ncbi:MAG TPA: hypothetical protein VF941_11840 [Clostridia bacterium]